uniref:Laccase 2 protein n=1 Tax=Cepaea nemoralis TaxID=28835 RepID=A0A6B9QIN7_CEPNE|nr:laccase 2 protein [Cepaea nemoralis]
MRPTVFTWRLQVLVAVLSFLSACEAKLLHHMSYDDIQDYRNHTCTRQCEDGGEAMVCDYNFLVEFYHTLTKACWDCPQNPASCSRPHCVAADGGLRGIITANRMLPGPSIHVCENDIIRVRVHNKMEGSQGTTIHWHGVLQHGSPYMDGVSMVTQCPIPTYTAFTYVFNATTVGTHFWHSHAGLQRADGLFGHLVVRQAPSREPHWGVYDFDLPEHELLVNDWWHRSADPSFAQHHHSDGDNKPSTILINGKGMDTVVCNNETKQCNCTPRELFTVKKGFRYRFRIISNGILNCPFRISVDEHSLEIIASDGAPVSPMEVESFNIIAGERYDFVLTANQSVDNYLIRVQGELDCGTQFKNAHQTAILHYEGAEEGQENNHTFISPPPSLTGLVLNPINSVETETLKSVANLRSLLPDDEAVTRKPDRKIVVAMDFVVIDNPRFHNKLYYSTRDFLLGNKQVQTTQMNGITNLFPPAPPLSQLQDIPEDMFCNDETVKKNCSLEFCECIHFYKVDLGDVVELMMIDQGHIWNASHPTHLHGHGFRVLAIDRLAASLYAHEVVEMDARGEISRNLDKPPLKDTVTIPDGGYTVVRFHANNPGIWFLHCHIEYHVEIGMGLIFQVGNQSQFPPVPPRFPTCGSWDPEEAKQEELDAERNQPISDVKPNTSTKTTAWLLPTALFIIVNCYFVQRFR